MSVHVYAEYAPRRPREEVDIWVDPMDLRDDTHAKVADATTKMLFRLAVELGDIPQGDPNTPEV